MRNVNNKKSSIAAANGYQKTAATQKKSGRVSHRGRNTRSDAPVARAFQLTQKSTGRTRMSGMDRLLHIPDVSALGEGSIPVLIHFGPDHLPRLKTLSNAFKRIRYLHLEFIVEPQISTASSGGYVASFIRDTADLPTGTLGLSMLTSSTGSRTTKWWESVTVAAGKLPDLYYTQTELSELRWSSPGIFALGVDGKCNTPGSPLTVYCRYTVEMSEPALEAAGSEYSQTLTAPGELYVVTGASHLRSDGGTTDPKKLLPGSVPGGIYELITPRYYTSSTDSKNYLVGYDRVIFDKDNTLKACNTDGSVITNQSAVDSPLQVKKGETLKYVSGNSQKGLQYLSVESTVDYLFV